jgi:aryl-alcohol dehydrogenase-like predicted oxidoreductase
MTETRRLGRTDIEITPIGLGCMQFARTGGAARVYDTPDAEVVEKTVRAALDGGVNWFDTAEMYGHGESERALTDALRAADVRPGDVRIATKWAPLGRRASNIGRTIDQRLAALQGYPIDLYQIHQPISFSSTAAEMREMAKLLRANKISAVGVSNFGARNMARAAAALAEEGIALASNQVQISLLHRKIERSGVLAEARRLGVTLIAYSPLRSGMLTGRFHDHPDTIARLSGLRRLGNNMRARELARTRPLIEELGRIARAYGVSRAQVALNWMIHFYGETVVAIPGASRTEQAREAAATLEFRLTDAELRRLDELSR